MYNEYFQKVGKAITAQIPEACIMRNQIPKGYVNYDLYVNLVANDDEQLQTYAQVPRIGAFEVSYKGYLFFSKLKKGYWPSCELLGQRAAQILRADRDGCEDLGQYMNTEPSMSKASIGRKRSRGKTPMKARRVSAGSSATITLTNLKNNEQAPDEPKLIYDNGDIWRPPMIDTSAQ